MSQKQAPRAIMPMTEPIAASSGVSMLYMQKFHEYIQRKGLKVEWIPSPLGKQWKMTYILRDAADTHVSEGFGLGPNKKQAQNDAAVKFMTGENSQGPKLPKVTAPNIVSGGMRTAPTSLSKEGGQALEDGPADADGEQEEGAPQEGEPVVAAPEQKVEVQQDEDEWAGMEDQEEEEYDSFGYTLATGRMRLNEYLTQRGLPIDVTTTGSGPWKAMMEVTMPNGKGVVWSKCISPTKKEAVKKVALRVLSELCKHGEVPIFRTRDEASKEPIVPCNAEMRPGLEEELDEVLNELNAGPNEMKVLDPDRPPSILRDFDCARWSTNPEARNISRMWKPPTWGKSPWGPSPTRDELRPEVEMNLQLKQEMEARDASIGYKQTRAKRQELPISKFEDEILETIERQAVTLISGSTGCGKTTQLPQMILERAIRQGKASSVNITITQPRRIAAITVAERVAKERAEQMGNSVGYNVRFAKNLPRGFASICYMTPGMCLRWLCSSGMRWVSHLVIDEVHERDLDTDFLLTIVKRVLKLHPTLRVIMMSATLDVAKWSDYFRLHIASVEVPGRLFDVDLFYLEDVLDMIGDIPKSEEPVIGPQISDDVPLEVIMRLIELLVKNSGKTKDRGAILVFLPGWESLCSVQARLKKDQKLCSRMKLYVLHSHVPKDEQQAAFHKAPPPLVKVVLSTNIAESSVTISDVIYVVDSCRVKQLTSRRGQGGRMAYRLANVETSKQSMQQRAGRAGRVRKGKCYRLIRKEDYEDAPDILEPDMVRLPLHQVTLTVKSLNLGRVEEFLSQAPDPPTRQSIKAALRLLMQLKALDWREHITELGIKLSKMPMEPRMGFALLAAVMLGLGEPMAIITCITNAPPLYLNEKTRGRFADDAPSMQLYSDHHEMLVTYYKLEELAEGQQEAACYKEGINYRTFLFVKECVGQTMGTLRQMDFDPEALGSCKEWIYELGTDAETDSHLQLWSGVTFLLGFGLEHFAMRKGMGRKVWIGQHRMSQVTLSPGVPENSTVDLLRPFLLINELREAEWQSRCNGVTAAGAFSTILGAARDLSYDTETGCLMVDHWAPVRMSPLNAARLVSIRMALRLCLLNIARTPRLLNQDPNIAAFRALLFDLTRPQAVEQEPDPGPVEMDL